jgi:bleomycin hydrolase
MKKTIILIITLSFIFCIVSFSKEEDKNKVIYFKKQEDKVMKQIKEERKAQQAKKDEITAGIKKRQKKEAKGKKAGEKVMYADLCGVYPPKSVKSFKTYFHFPPVPQDRTNTCWSFSATSFLEAEIYRLTGKKIELSKIWAPYFELIEKSRRFIRERGESYVAGGAESNSVTRIWKEHGIVPVEVYTGVKEKGAKHDHTMLMKELEGYLEYIKKNNLWDEKENIEHIRLILDKYLGSPPESFNYEGKTKTPLEFFRNDTGLNLDDYCSVMSTCYFPFYTRQEFRAPDNWWHNKTYINLPLDVWYEVIKNSIRSGYTIVIGGDVSEPGRIGSHDVAFIPTFDIPSRYIDQDSREYRIYNKTTGDDHGIHLVGYTRFKDKDWFLVKDSGRSSRKGQHEGYYFFREDFIKLKMLTFTVHKDMLRGILPKIKR